MVACAYINAESAKDIDFSSFESEKSIAEFDCLMNDINNKASYNYLENGEDGDEWEDR